MRTASESLITFLDSHTVGTWAHLVTITPRAGSAPVTSTVYWTDHSADITIGGHTFLAGGSGTVPIITFGKRTEMAGTEIGSLDISLGCGTGAQFNGVRLPLAAASRAFDGATVKVERVFGDKDLDLTLGTLHVFEGLVAEARPSSTVVELDVESGLAALNVEIPAKLFKPGCTNILFDAQCGISKAAKTITAEVASVGTTLTFATDCAQADGYFDLGVLTFAADTDTVALRGISRAVRTYLNSSGIFTVDRPLPVAPAGGDTFSVYPGCPKTLTACETKFGTDNRAHFRGFPKTPRDKESPLARIVAERAWNRKPYEQPGTDSATYGKPVQILYGKNRIKASFIYWGSYVENHIAAQAALCEGPIAGVDGYYGTNFYKTWSGALLDLQITNLHADLGTRPTQTPWTALPAGADLGYPGVAVVSGNWKIDNGEVFDPEWEVRGFLDATGGADDAAPDLIIQDLFPNGKDPVDDEVGYYGAAFDWPIVTTTGRDGNEASSCQRYCAQNEFYLSPIIEERRQAIDYLADICEAINCEPLWTEGKLEIVPRADTEVGTGAGKFSPVISIRYAFTEADLIGGGDSDPVSLRISPETETFNVCPVTFSERAPEGVDTDPTLAYNEATDDDPDPVDVAFRGEREASAVRLLGVCRREHALKISRILAQRQVRTRQEIEFSIPWRFVRLEPLDLVTITDSLFPYTAQPFQVRQIEEDMRAGVLLLTCACFEAGVNHSTSHPTQSSDGGTTQWGPYDTEVRLHELAAANRTAMTGLSGDYYAVASNGTISVAVGSGSNCATAGVEESTWTEQTIPAGDYYAVAWNGSIFVAVGASVCATSTNGVTWTPRTIPAGTYRAIAWNGSVFAAVGTGTVAASSTDGTTWNARTIPSGDYLGIATDGSKFVAVGPSGAAATSSNGTTWVDQTIAAEDFYSVAWNGSVFAAVGNSACAASADGVTWTSGATGSEFPGYHYGIATSGPIFVSVGHLLFATSRDGLEWQQIELGTDFRSAAWTGRRFVAVAFTGQSAMTQAVPPN